MGATLGSDFVFSPNTDLSDSVSRSGRVCHELREGATGDAGSERSKEQSGPGGQGVWVVVVLVGAG